MSNKNNFRIREMNSKDIVQVAQVHAEAFPRQLLSYEWIQSNFNAFPRIRCYVSEIGTETVGYVQWSEKSGFRKEVVLELEQIAVLFGNQKQGIGTALILQSLHLIKEELKKRNAYIKHILVTTRTDNDAQKLYTKTFRAQPEVIISNLFSADEVIMIARNIEATSYD